MNQHLCPEDILLTTASNDLVQSKLTNFSGNSSYSLIYQMGQP